MDQFSIVDSGGPKRTPPQAHEAEFLEIVNFTRRLTLLDK